MDSLRASLFDTLQGGGGDGGNDETGRLPDEGETIVVSSLALLKMLRHARAGVPLEVMGIMLGQQVDEYTIRVVDVFATPQAGSQVSVESIDEKFQVDFMEHCKLTGRPEDQVGWYHSHPSYGCWLSHIDVEMQKQFENLDKRSVAVVVDPIQSVKGRVVIEAFRTLPMQGLGPRVEVRQITSNIGRLVKPSVEARTHGLDRTFYSLPIGYRKSEREQSMLRALSKQHWTSGMRIPDAAKLRENNASSARQLGSYAKTFCNWIKESSDRDSVENVGRANPKLRMDAIVSNMLEANLDALVSIMATSLVY